MSTSGHLGRASLLERLELISRRGDDSRRLDAEEARVALEWITELSREFEAATCPKCRQTPCSKFLN